MDEFLDEREREAWEVESAQAQVHRCRISSEGPDPQSRDSVSTAFRVTNLRIFPRVREHGSREPTDGKDMTNHELLSEVLILAAVLLILLIGRIER
jgi:hypothetical protein